MNVVKWAKEIVKKGGGAAKGTAARKRITKKLPELAKKGGTVGAIAKRRLQQRKILEELDK